MEVEQIKNIEIGDCGFRIGLVKGATGNYFFLGIYETSDKEKICPLICVGRKEDFEKLFIEFKKLDERSYT